MTKVNPARPIGALALLEYLSLKSLSVADVMASIANTGTYLQLTKLHFEIVGAISVA